MVDDTPPERVDSEPYTPNPERAVDVGQGVLGLARDAPTSGKPQSPPWSRIECKYMFNFREMLHTSGSILRDVHFWKLPFALMFSPRWFID